MVEGREGVWKDGGRRQVGVYWVPVGQIINLGGQGPRQKLFFILLEDPASSSLRSNRLCCCFFQGSTTANTKSNINPVRPSTTKSNRHVRSAETVTLSSNALAPVPALVSPPSTESAPTGVPHINGDGAPFASSPLYRHPTQKGGLPGTSAFVISCTSTVELPLQRRTSPRVIVLFIRLCCCFTPFDWPGLAAVGVHTEPVSQKESHDWSSSSGASDR